MSAPPLPPGVLGIHALPADHHDGPWDSIYLPEGAKERLLGAALLNLRHGRSLQGLSGAPHGLILLAGPPGTGKTMLAQGLAQVAALALAGRGATTLVEVDPHAFPSEMLGESQRAVSELFNDTLPELAARRPHLIVIIDEVESLAVRRSSASFETNPVDVHRATDAVLLGLDQLRVRCPNALLVVTTNFPDAVDEAVLSRADHILRTQLPDRDVLALIFGSSLEELSVHWPALRPLSEDAALHEELAAICEGIDGRRARKVVLSALAASPALALDPSTLTGADLRAAAQAAATTSGF